MTKIEKHEIIETEKGEIGLYSESKSKDNKGGVGVPDYQKAVKKYPKKSPSKKFWDDVDKKSGVTEKPYKDWNRTAKDGMNKFSKMSSKDMQKYRDLYKKRTGEDSGDIRNKEDFYSFVDYQTHLEKEKKRLSKRKRPIAFKRTRTTKHAPKVSGLRGPGKGWHRQPTEHSRASKLGWARRRR